MTKNQEGFTLIEILASIVILSIVLSLIIGVSGQIITSTNKSDKNILATTKAEEILNKIRNDNTLNFTGHTETIYGQEYYIYDTKDPIGNAVTNIIPSNFKNRVSISGILFTTTTDPSYGTYTGPHTVTVTVAWEE